MNLSRTQICWQDFIPNLKCFSGQIESDDDRLTFARHLFAPIFDETEFGSDTLKFFD